MTHAEFVQTATDLLSETWEPTRWLESYDSAMARPTDWALREFVEKLSREAALRNPIAA